MCKSDLSQLPESEIQSNTFTIEQAKMEHECEATYEEGKIEISYIYIIHL